MDPLPGLVGFATALREAGVACGPAQVRAYLDAVAVLDAADVGQLYWAGRLTLCAEPDELPRYDDAFHAWFAGEAPGVPKRTRKPAVKRGFLRATGDLGAGADVAVRDVERTASDTEVLRHRDISGLTADERAHLRDLIALLRPDPPLRPALRWRPDRRGPIDEHRTLRILRAAGGEPVRLARKRRRSRPRRIVLLIDVSGSMSPYADALLRFAHAMARRCPVEVFTLGTRLTRLTRQLRQRDPEFALAAAARAVPDFAGGTRLGETMRAFLDRWGQRGVARQAVVVVFSDGWERGDPALLGEQMARLGRLAHRVLWVNPHAGSPEYQPVQSGIAAALPYLHQLLAGHSLATLDRLLREVRRA
ncbi:carbon monoxide dehydrogenase E protein [Alloactinosynnema sp. L-07]|uniref:vWA domain-containing protein n=1 Tax=Alloactinosynnema sp. L-07 TaxID=1653480 RepID=UPI00065F044E|nr:VWA domain-containing protein [Alloactinosynnema sp. L-07]CRK60261.1 carbon monoxide dehydrogenase E protein [Alloactinosynnema sp. L-07]